MDRRFFLKNVTCVFSIPIIQKYFFSNFFISDKYKIFSKIFFSMGTMGRICVISKDENVWNILHKTIKRILFLEGKLTKFLVWSDIGRLNLLRCADNISDETLKVLKLSVLMQSKTDNYFNVTINPFMFELNKFNLQCSPKTNILLFNDPFVSLTMTGYNIDLGGIGKGYIIQDAMNYLISVGVEHSFIEIGGDVKVYGGLPNGKSWDILVANSMGYTNRLFKLHTGSISTSGKYRKRFSTHLVNKNSFHIIDPTTSSFNTYYNRVTVIGDDLSICDALSTACYNVPPLFFKEFINSFNKYTFDVD